MNIFDRESAEVLQTGMRYVDRFYLPSTAVTVEHLNDGFPDEITNQFEHELCLKLFIRFKANRAQFDTALGISKTAMLHFLYRDALSQVAIIRKFAMDGDRDGIFHHLGELEKAMGLKP